MEESQLKDKQYKAEIKKPKALLNVIWRIEYVEN